MEQNRPEAIEEVNLEGCDNVKSLVEWAKEQQDIEGSCVPCDFSVIAPWYRDLLKEKGYEDLSERVDAIADTDQNPASVAETLDKIKEEVDNQNVKDNLTLYDCIMQSDREEAPSGED